MFVDSGYEIILKSLQKANINEVPVSSFVNINGINFKPFTNKVYTNKSHLKHAEILAINYALKKLGVMDFKNHNATLYSSLEPCCMCLSFACLVRVSKIIYYAEDKKFGGIERVFTLNSTFYKPEFLFIEKEEVKKYMNNFFKNKR